MRIALGAEPAGQRESGHARHRGEDHRALDHLSVDTTSRVFGWKKVSIFLPTAFLP